MLRGVAKVPSGSPAVKLLLKFDSSTDTWTHLGLAWLDPYGDLEARFAIRTGEPESPPTIAPAG